MKKYILGCLIFLMGTGFSQGYISKATKEFNDDFMGAELADTANPEFGIFWNEKEVDMWNGVFKVELDRVPDSVGMLVTVANPTGSFNYFDFNFGEDASGNPHVMDLSTEGVDGDVFFGTSVTNLSGYNLRFRVALVDSNGMVKNTYSESTLGPDFLLYQFSPIYAGDFELIIDSDETSEFEDNITGVNYIQFARSHNKYWSKMDSTVRCRPCHDAGEYLDDFLLEPNNRLFNWGAVVGMRFYVINVEHIGEYYDNSINPDSAEFFNYGPEAIVDAKIRINSMWLRAGFDVDIESPQDDNDFDGVINASDNCPDSQQGYAVDVNGCNEHQSAEDHDGDGVVNSEDQCPGTSIGTEIDPYGCFLVDSDKDGLYDFEDDCPFSGQGVIDSRGCVIDSDGDGVLNDKDECARTPFGSLVDDKGCLEDFDGDGVLNASDACPRTLSGQEVDINGCSIDDDRDGVLNAEDVCPNSSVFAVVNAQGCEEDSDNDGVDNSLDVCPGTSAGAEVDGIGCVVLTEFSLAYGFGCMDPDAINYTPYTACPGPCIYPSEPIPTSLSGCTDANATNYNPFATISTTCYYEIPEQGCTDMTAINYDAEASIDDGTCEYGVTGDVMGCTDLYAYNYSQEATIDNGTCEYYQEYLDTALVIYGCRDATALNYSFNATFDNGSCLYEQDTVENEIVFEGEITDTVDTEISFCEFNYNLLVDSVLISDQEVFTDSIVLEWSIYQRGIPTRVRTTLSKAVFEEDEASLLYLNMDCGAGSGNRVAESKSITFRAVYQEQKATAVEQESFVESFLLTPNPFNDQIIVEEIGAGLITILNAKGMVVKVVECSGENLVIPTSDLPKGYYTIQYQSEEGEIFNKGMIK